MLELLRDGHGVESWSPAGDIARISFAGDDLLVAVDRDDSELARRRSHRLGVLTDRRALRVLLTLPRGVAVPTSFLTERDLRVLHSLPSGILELTDTDVRVVIAPAVSLFSIGVVARTWAQGLRISSPYAAYCARYVVLDRPHGPRTPPIEAAAMEARYLGVGLATHRADRLDWHVSPAPFEADRYSESSWLMAERFTAALSVARR